MNVFVFTASHPGVLSALAAAVLFGASTPLAKLLLGTVDPVLLAGLLYLGSGSGLVLWQWLRRWRRASASPEARLKRSDLPWLMSAIVTGGVIGPVLLMIGLATTPASSASLLLNLEGVFTATVAWCVFKEHHDRRIVWGMAAIATGGLVLSWTGRPEVSSFWGNVAIIGACLAWAMDNNLTRKISAGDPVQIAGTKGLAAGMVNLVIAFAAGANVPSTPTVLTAAVVGFLGYGVSLVLFILALRYIGTARTGAYFSLAPFAGATISILVLGDRLTTQLLVAAALMGLGAWLHLTERHAHEHWHEPLAHEHGHLHDAHHPHGDDAESHSHLHTHQALHHSHPHYPDIHHRHGH
jgi:drug/metabolite transporter (DMT)-like permease